MIVASISLTLAASFSLSACWREKRTQTTSAPWNLFSTQIVIFAPSWINQRVMRWWSERLIRSVQETVWCRPTYTRRSWMTYWKTTSCLHASTGLSCDQCWMRAVVQCNRACYSEFYSRLILWHNNLVPGTLSWRYNVILVRSLVIFVLKKYNLNNTK